jgi:choloylglycine hydrolase
MWTTEDGAVLVGRNMDWLQDMGTNLWALPAGVERDGLVQGGLSWTARHGSVVATSYDVTTSDGVNDAGLAAHMLWLAESDYGERDPSRPALALSVWAQYFLDNFATVAEAVAFLDETPLQPVAQVDPVTGRDVTVHLALDDSGGDSAIIEYVGGTMRVHHSPSFTVVTNSPPFEEQLERLRGFAGFGGEAPLPGTTEAADRFARAAYYVDRLPPPASGREAVAAILSVMRNAAQPFGTADPARPNISATIWRTVAHLTGGLYFFESSFSPNIVWVDVGALDLSPGAPARKLDVAGSDADLIGDATAQLRPSEPFAFLAPAAA